MGQRFGHLVGCCAFIRHGLLAFILVSGAQTSFGGVFNGGPPPLPPPPGCLQVKIDAPDNINSAVQWHIDGHPNEQLPERWFNNGDMVSAPSGNYYITFRTIVGWATPGSQLVGIPAYATNTFLGSYNFVSLSGNCQGLFSETSEPRYESSGLCGVSGTKTSAFSGKVFSGGHRYSFSGKFDKAGNAWSTIRRSGASPLSVHVVAGEDIVTGEITNETWTATILAKRNTFNSKTRPAPQAGKYTFAFPGSTNSNTQPRGDSFGTMTVNASGGITLAVTLSDGTKAAQKTFLSKDGRWPFYVSLYSGKGLAFGWLQLQGQSELNPPKVELYRDCNYAEVRVLLAPGDYNFVSLYYSGLYYVGYQANDMDAPRSIKVPIRWTVTLYTNDFFSDTPFATAANDPCLVDDGVIGIRSIRVSTNAVGQLADYGNVTWIKPSGVATKCYPAGFTNQMQAFVSAYQSSGNDALLSSTNGIISFQNGDPTQSITNIWSVDSSGRISGANDFSLRISASSGSLKGKMLNPATGEVISFGGVVLQKQHFGRGFFLDGGQSGSVYLGPAESE